MGKAQLGADFHPLSSPAPAHTSALCDSCEPSTNPAFLLQIEAEDQELATFCGRETTDTEQAPGQQVILSPGPYMGLTFRSDFSNEERFTGFDAHYTAVGKQHAASGPAGCEGLQRVTPSPCCHHPT